MKSLVNSSLALAAAATLALLLGAWTTQDAKKPAPPGQDAPKKSEPAQDASAKARADHMAAFAKAFASLKTPLGEAIAIAEKETKGKAHGADVELGKDGKLTIEIRLLVGDKFDEVYVDQDTKQVTRPEKGKGHDDDEEGEEHEGHEGH